MANSKYTAAIVGRREKKRRHEVSPPSVLEAMTAKFPGAKPANKSDTEFIPQFLMELTRAGSPFAVAFSKSYSRPYSEPPFSAEQLVAFALLTNDTRTLTLKNILHVIFYLFPYYMQGVIEDVLMEPARPRQSQQDSINAKVREVLQDNVEKYDMVFVPRGYADNVQDQITSQWAAKVWCAPRISAKFYLPRGQENVIFAPYYRLSTISLSIAMPAFKSGQKTAFITLPTEIKRKILSLVLIFAGKIVVRAQPDYYDEKDTLKFMIGIMTEDPDDHADELIAPQPKELLDILRVSKEFNEIGKETFYSNNTFVLEKKVIRLRGRTRHGRLRVGHGLTDKFLAFLLRTKNYNGAPRVGKQPGRLIRSIEFGIGVENATTLRNLFHDLGQATHLQRLVINVDVNWLSRAAQQDWKKIPGFASLRKFRGLHSITLPNLPQAEAEIRRIVTAEKKNGFYGPALRQPIPRPVKRNSTLKRKLSEDSLATTQGAHPPSRFCLTRALPLTIPANGRSHLLILQPSGPQPIVGSYLLPRRSDPATEGRK